MSSICLADQWCGEGVSGQSGEVKYIMLNSDYNNDVIKVRIGDVTAELNDTYLSEFQKKNILALLLTAQTTGSRIKYIGTSDCKKIQKDMSHLTYNNIFSNIMKYLINYLIFIYTQRILKVYL